MVEASVRERGAACVNLEPSPTTSIPRPSPTVVQAPPASGLEIAGALLAIVFALAAAVIGYRIIRGGRGL